MRTEERWKEAYEENFARQYFTKRIYRDLKTARFPELPDLDFANGQGLYLHGDTGSGKTLLAARVLLEEKKRVWLQEPKEPKEFKFASTPQLISDIKQTFNLPNPTKNLTAEQQILKQHTEVYFLVLDDFGITAKVSDWVLNTLYLIVNGRLEKCLPTIFTSNLDVYEIAETFDDRIAARIKRMCDIVEKTWWDEPDG